MKNGRMQAKDCPDQPILDALDRKPGEWHNVWEPRPDGGQPSLVPAFPPGAPEKVMRAKMNSLIRRGLVGGCECGKCRGDYHRPKTW